MRTPRLLALPAAVVLATALAACGGGSTTAESTPTTASSPSATPTPTPTVEALTAENAFARLTAAQKATTSYDMHLSMTGPAAMEMTGSADLADGKQNIVAIMSDPEMGPLEVRFVDGVLYLNMGELTGGKFLQLDPNDASNPLGAAFSGITESLGANDLTGMEQAFTSVTAVGEPEQLDGVEVQKYDIVVDTTKIAPEATQELLAEGLAQLPPTITYSYWLDAQDLPRKVTYDIAGTTTTMTLTNVNAGTPVTAPTPDQVTTEMPF
ncbi:hypothetical protein GC089_03390 [Cellulomonas sp. JZ18]|uniref:hypothetical protein n=1 Tax=Cellulomonas sp. JZ18 TaxID=2654191 RepID=UPI0012D4B40B|nr:hypothetical protein [Cellulomonas sp. JZ18]QGQ18472.1 hypothetical protein GC089_03390 [Cellulomonas sp. JZ18]